MTTTADTLDGTNTGPAPAAPEQYLCVVFPEEAEAAEAEIPWAQRIVWPCRKGQIIARVLPAEQAPLDGARQLAIPLGSAKLGRRTEWNESHTEVRATEAGHIRLRKDLLEVEEAWTVTEDLDATGGPIDFPGPVQITKNVLDLVKLSADGEITVHGSVEAAKVHSRTNVTIHHGVCSKNHGLISADGNVSVRFASNARIRAAGSILVGNEINNSELSCWGSVLAEHASLISGHVAAVCKISCDTAGSESAVRVLLELSLSPEEMARVEPILAELKSLRQRSEHIRASIEPLMKDPKRLTSQQKEKATELLCTAAEYDMRSDELHKSLEAARKQLEQVMNGVVEIKGRVYPEVTVAIAGVQTTFKKEMTGPVKIVRRDEHHMPTLVAIDSHNHGTALQTSTTPLHTLLHTLRMGATGQ